MQLSAPIYHLKRLAKLYARNNDVPLHAALNHIAASEGAQSWGHLMSAKDDADPVLRILDQLSPGDLVLLGARPHQGKTVFGLTLAAQAHRIDRTGRFFTLDYHREEIGGLVSDLGGETPAFKVDAPDAISAGFVIDRLGDDASTSVAVVDYLQVLDQKRSNPSLEEQVATLKTFAIQSRAIIILISQIEREFDVSGKSVPDHEDVRLPNPVKISHFDKAIFLHAGQIKLTH